jgi:hypothetical protein
VLNVGSKRRYPHLNIKFSLPAQLRLLMASVSCGNQPAKSHADETTQGVDHRSDNLLTPLDLRGISGENRSPKLLGSWTLDNQLKMFTTICHFSSEIFKSPDLRKD